MLSTSNPPARRSCVRHDATSIMANTTPTAPPPYAVGSYNLDAANATTDPDHHPNEPFECPLIERLRSFSKTAFKRERNCVYGENQHHKKRIDKQSVFYRAGYRPIPNPDHHP